MGEEWEIIKAAPSVAPTAKALGFRQLDLSEVVEIGDLHAAMLAIDGLPAMSTWLPVERLGIPAGQLLSRYGDIYRPTMEVRMYTCTDCRHETAERVSKVDPTPHRCRMPADPGYHGCSAECGGEMRPADGA